MRPAMRPALFLWLVAALTLPALADKAKDFFVKGQDAEARQQFEAAYDFYKQAYDLKPKELRYRAAFEHARFEAASTIVHRGQKLREDGKLDEAVAEFRSALNLEPGNLDARVNLALAERSAGQLDRAKETLLDVLNRAPANAPAHYNLAQLYDQTNEPARAVEHYRLFLEHAGAEHSARAAPVRARIAALSKMPE